MIRRRWLPVTVLAVTATFGLGACTSNDTSTKAAGSTKAGGSNGGSHLDSVLKNKTLRVGMTLKFPPEMYRDKANKPAGYDVELVTQMAKDLGVKLDIQDQEFEGLIPALQANKVDLISVGLVNTPERAKTIWFSKPYVPYRQVVVVNNNKVSGTDTTQLDKKGTIITALTGSTAAELVKKNFPSATLRELDQQPAFLEVLSGRAQGVVVEQYLAAPFVRKNSGKVRIMNPNQPFATQYGAYGLPNGDLDWQTWVNNWLDYWRANGYLDATYNRIIGPTLK